MYQRQQNTLYPLSWQILRRQFLALLTLPTTYKIWHLWGVKGILLVLVHISMDAIVFIVVQKTPFIPLVADILLDWFLAAFGIVSSLINVGVLVH